MRFEACCVYRRARRLSLGKGLFSRILKIRIQPLQQIRRHRIAILLVQHFVAKAGIEAVANILQPGLPVALQQDM